MAKSLFLKYSFFFEQLDLVEQLEDKGRIVVIRPEKPMEVDRIETDIKKLTDLYEEGYACAKKMFVVNTTTFT